jgi:hypothetical protein
MSLRNPKIRRSQVTAEIGNVQYMFILLLKPVDANVFKVFHTNNMQLLLQINY